MRYESLPFRAIEHRLLGQTTLILVNMPTELTGVNVNYEIISSPTYTERGALLKLIKYCIGVLFYV